MEPDRAVADLELFVAERGQPLLRTAILLTGSARSGGRRSVSSPRPGPRPY